MHIILTLFVTNTLNKNMVWSRIDLWKFKFALKCMLSDLRYIRESVYIKKKAIWWKSTIVLSSWGLVASSKSNIEKSKHMSIITNWWKPVFSKSDIWIVTKQLFAMKAFDIFHFFRYNLICIFHWWYLFNSWVDMSIVHVPLALSIVP